MKRKIIRIDKEKCNGCGLCVHACHEGAIGMSEGKAKLVKESYCDGLGDCLPVCPAGAISFEEREAPAYDEEEVKKNKSHQWPLQIKLVPLAAPFYENADVLIAADCTAFAYRQFHEELARGKALLVGCPKLDMVDYSEKLTRIIADNDVKSITVARMEVPCCGGMEMAVKRAVENSGKAIPVDIVTIGINGQRLIEMKGIEITK